MADERKLSKVTKTLRDAEGYPLIDAALDEKVNAFRRRINPEPPEFMDPPQPGGDPQDNFDNPGFNFDDCDPPEEIFGPLPCADCIKDPLAFVPDWTRLAEKEVFFDGRECLYSAVIHKPASITTISIDPTATDVDSKPRSFYIREGLTTIIEFYNKKTIIPIVEYVPYRRDLNPLIETGLESDSNKRYRAEESEINVVDAILELDVVQVKEIIDPRPNIKTKYLISLPTEFISTLPDVPVTSQPGAIPLDGKLKVQFMGDEIKQQFGVMANRLNGAMSVYHRQYQIWLRLGGGVFKETVYDADRELFEESNTNYKLDLKTKAERMRDFLDALREMLGSQGMVIPGFSPSLSLIAPNVDRIIINFENIDNSPGGRLRIKNIKANRVGCSMVVFASNRQSTKNAFEKLESQFRNTTLLAYIGQLPEANRATQARDPSDWLDWTLKYTYPPITVQLGLNANDPASNVSLGSCFVGGQILDPLEEILTSLGEDLGKVLQDKFHDTVCMTPQELEEKLTQQRARTKAARAEAEKAKNTYKAAKQVLKDLKQEAKTLGASTDEIGSHDGTSSPLEAQINVATLQFNQERVQELTSEPGGLIAQQQAIVDRAKKDLREKRVYLSKDLTEKLGSPSGTAYEINTYLATDPVLNTLPKLLDSFVKKGKSSKKNLWHDVIAKLGDCGLLSLQSQAMKCLLKGITDFDGEAKPILVEAAFKAMDEVNIEKMFFGLTPEQQADVMAEIEKNFSGVKPPWQDTRRAGTWSSPGWGKEELLTESNIGLSAEQVQRDEEESRKDYNKRIDDLVEETGITIPEARKARRTEIRDSLFNDEDLRVLPGGGVQRHPVKGSFATALEKSQVAVFNAYRDAMLEAVGVDVLFDRLMELPGAALIAEIIKDIPCKKPPPWRIDPPLGEFFQIGELDPCALNKANGSLRFPPVIAIKKPVNAGYIPSLIYSVLKEVAEELIFLAAVLIIREILDLITRLTCLALSALGASLTDLLTGSNRLMDLLRNELCGVDARNTEIEEAITNLVRSVGDAETDCLREMDPAEMGDFIDTISATLLQTEILSLLSGNPNSETLQIITEAALLSGSECIAEIFSDAENIKDLFKSLGNIIDTSGLEDAVKELEGNPLYSSPTICGDPVALDNVNKIRCYLLTKKGLTKEECEEEIDKAKDKVLDDLGNIADIMQGNKPEVKLNSSGPNLCGPEDGVFPYNSVAYLDAADALTDAMFEDLSIAYSRDLLGAGGLLTMMLADTNGKGLIAHNFFVNILGASKAENLPIIGFYTDNAIGFKAVEDTDEETKKNRPIRKTGEAFEKNTFGNSAFVSPLLGINAVTGGLPPGVASYLKDIFKNFDSNFEYKTRIYPDGFESIEALRAEQNRIDRKNSIVKQMRSDYIEMWLALYKDDWEGKNANKAGRIDKDLRIGIEQKLFNLSTGNRTSRAGMGPGEGNTPEYLAAEVLEGKQVWGGLGHKFAGGTKDITNRWSKGARRQANKTAYENNIPSLNVDQDAYVRGILRIQKYFTENYPPEYTEYEDQVVSSVGDLELRYTDYLDEYSFTIEYDANPVDKDGLLMSFPPADPDEVRRTPDGISFGKGAQDSYTVIVKERYNEVVQEGIGDDRPANPLPGIQTEGFYTTDILRGGADILSQPEVQILINDVLDVPAELEKVQLGKAGFEKSIEGLSKQSTTFNTLMKRALIGSDLADEDTLYPGIINLSEVGEDALEAGATLTRDQFGFLIRQNQSLIDLSVEQRVNRFDQISQYYVSLLAERVSENNRSWNYGYNENQEPNIYLLDPEKYGGTDAAPPFYIERPDRGGWLGLLDDIIPEWDGCEPRKTDLINFGSLKKLVNDRNVSLVDDPRLNFDPLCVEESPYDKLMEKYTAASLEGIVAATIRMYVAEMMLQGLPVFSLFHIRIPENFDSILFQYISNRMETALIEEGTKDNLFGGGRIDRSYWYQFIEQAVMSYIRRLPPEYNPSGNGEITDPTAEELNAYANIQAAIETFYHIEKYDYDPDNQGLASMTDNAINGQSVLKRIMEKRPTAVRRAKNAPNTTFSKIAAKKAKKLAFDTIMEDTMGDAKILLARVVREEMQRLAEEFNEAMQPSIYSMHQLLLGNKKYMYGALTQNDGTPSDPAQVGREAMDTIFSDRKGKAIITRDSNGNIIGDPPFILQIYVRPQEATGEFEDAYPAIFGIAPGERTKILNGRPENLKGVVDLTEWDTYIKEKKEAGLSGDISQFFGPGTEKTVDESGSEVQIGQSGWSFGLRICYIASSDEEVRTFTNMINDIGTDRTPNLRVQQSAFQKLPSGNILVPVAHGELEIPDQEFTNFDPASYDIDCLIAELIKDPAYKVLFEYCFPLKTFLSMITIYTVKSLLPSIGNSGRPEDGGDYWVTAGGKAMSGFRLWDGRRDPFKKSTKKARRMFETLYNSTIKDNTYNDRNDAGQKEKWFKKLYPKWNYDLGLRWWMMPRKRARPFDKYGNECD